jgi:hypothetical protein
VCQMPDTIPAPSDKGREMKTDKARVARSLLRLFGGRGDCCLRDSGSGLRTVWLNHPLGFQEFDAHVRGECCYGVILLVIPQGCTGGSGTWMINMGAAKKIRQHGSLTQERLNSLGLSSLAERSQSRFGPHLTILFVARQSSSGLPAFTVSGAAVEAADLRGLP